MISSKIKSLVIVFALLLVTGVMTVGCQQKNDGMVNTNSMPGHRLQKYRKYINYDTKADKSTIVQKSENTDNSADFGPKNVSFDFQNLK